MVEIGEHEKRATEDPGTVADTPPATCHALGDGQHPLMYKHSINILFFFLRTKNDLIGWRRQNSSNQVCPPRGEECERDMWLGRVNLNWWF